MLQLTVPELRSFTNVRALKRELKACQYNIQTWRDSTYPLAKKCNFGVLDMKNGENSPYLS
jgi:hypothetical protein